MQPLQNINSCQKKGYNHILREKPFVLQEFSLHVLRGGRRILLLPPILISQMENVLIMLF